MTYPFKDKSHVHKRIGTTKNIEKHPGVNFINVIRANFCTNVVSAAFSSYMYVVKAAKKTFVQKNCTFNVDEIDYRTCSNELSKANFLFRQKNMSFIENVSLFSLVRKCVSMPYLIQISFIYLDKFMK